MTSQTHEIPLSRGLVALVDVVDVAIVTALGKWYADPRGKTFYARKNFHVNGRSWSVKMHTHITGWDLVDHINGNGLDNRRVNLRQADRSQNAMNRGTRRNRPGQFKGVYPNKWGWYAVITCRGERHHLGSFDDPVVAALAYDNAARELFGEFARPNFPAGVAA